VLYLDNTVNLFEDYPPTR